MRKNRPDTTSLRLVPSLHGTDRRSLEQLARHTDATFVVIEGRAFRGLDDRQAS